MVISQNNKRSFLWISLLILVLGSNFLLYRSPISAFILTEEMKWTIFGSLFDLAIIAPILILAVYGKRAFTIKRFIILMAGGLILARFLIPKQYITSFSGISYIGFAIEGSLIVFELFLIFAELFLLYVFIRNIPSIIRKVKLSKLSPLYSLPISVKEKVRNLPIIHIVVSEILMFYYAFATWGKRLKNEDEIFTLHKNSSLIAFHILIIHSIVIETIGIHWWLHDKVFWLSIILLILNIYTIIFLISNIQVIRLNPVKVVNNHLYLSLGLVKKMVIPINQIASITTDNILLKEKINTKTTIEFVARDLEEVNPHMILELKKPCNAILF